MFIPYAPKYLETSTLSIKIYRAKISDQEETKKAAIDFSRTNENGESIPLPIVKINREQCAISEINKINDAFKSYLETKDISLLPSIVTQFENNRVGNKSPHNYIRETYFSQNSMQLMLNMQKRRYIANKPYFHHNA